MKATLPIHAVLPALIDAVRLSPCAVLSAAPGAGKTSCVPLALLASGAVNGRVVMLEPRRLAAVRAAQYMAQQLGEKVGETVGYRIRGDNRVSAHTKIEVVTEGILARMIQHDPELSGIGLIIFDEFHERSLHADLGLALACDVQKNWRDDLKILVMSATLDGVAVSTLLDNAPVIDSEGRSYPVDIHYL
ncbi:MAG: DEAD/DEAH box helicase, partial [Pseudomonadales bacterium]|nr:DEAD/DEAH box helicase [Pseudomonadales bacterium]